MGLEFPAACVYTAFGIRVPADVERLYFQSQALFPQFCKHIDLFYKKPYKIKLMWYRPIF
jgi:hypothetical protein